MKVSILVINIVLPMLVSVGLYTYGLISTRWSSIDENLMDQHNSTNKQQEEYMELNNNNNVHFESLFIRHGFRSHYGLFGYCIDYKWLYLLTIKSKSNKDLYCPQCDSPSTCPETGCCMKRCNNIPDCPSYADEHGCNRPFNETRYYWKEGNCIWHPITIDNEDIPRYLSSYSTSSRDFHHYLKRLRHYVMLLLFVAAPLLTLMSLLILFCVNCIDRFYSVPFAFVSLFSLLSFVSGSGGLGVFLYEWIYERTYRPDFTFELNQNQSLILALNPWIINVERLGLAFWIVVAAIGTNLFTAILSCCFCCGLQTDKSKFRIHIKNDKYAIIHTSPYDE
ncbi:unnamed protein product [Rotaria magnacalcarata]|uniref:Uncharacterized protein n=2 Tax=Rotaria magnacalcarata TaxID=392030 RepID=A0A815ZS04_9BILA|nr:unnamed protein product [Rotaria magnacalcarata]CAF1586427.1 unnamed protein product [Rotaria magnacalcarata]CAF2141556.1 unnamed protein product [Rotaria magnacalcarata]CAF3968461.1 unnamed protein product [Rotaria magnacalcarata]CAF4045804.1 unnamed protein product [Rotaria magnacalcarata]